jgi:hypothetical protein
MQQERLSSANRAPNQLLYSSSCGDLRTVFSMVSLNIPSLRLNPAIFAILTSATTPVLNSHFQTALNLSAANSAGLSSAYFGAYFICPPTISGWILRRYGFRVTFMTGML